MPPSPTRSPVAARLLDWCFTPTAAVNTPVPSTPRLAKEHGVRLSVGRAGQCWDNAVAESFFSTVKTELLNRQPWPTQQAARQAIFEYIEGWYNTRRRHSSLRYLSPAAFEATSSHPLPAGLAA